MMMPFLHILQVVLQPVQQIAQLQVNQFHLPQSQHYAKNSYLSYCFV